MMEAASFTVACPCGTSLTCAAAAWSYVAGELTRFQERHEQCRLEAMLALIRPKGPLTLAGRFKAKAVCHVCTMYVDDATGRFPCGHNDERNAEYLEEKQDAA